jgi:hypothetical protein
MVWPAQAGQQSGRCSTEAVTSDQHPASGVFKRLKKVVFNLSQSVSKARMY